jgi:CheY-like chemotaxis protein
MLGRIMTTTTSLAPHVLTIDDDPAIRELIVEYLGENDLRVTAVATGAEMEKVLAEHAVDVVVLDLRLGGEDGMQIAKKLRDSSEIPIIIVSGRKDEADRVMALELGADDYLTKPANSACWRRSAPPRNECFPASSFSIFPACTTRRSTIARSTSRSSVFGARSRRIRRSQRTSRPNAGRAISSTPRSRFFTEIVASVRTGRRDVRRPTLTLEMQSRGSETAA